MIRLNGNVNDYIVWLLFNATNAGGDIIATIKDVAKEARVSVATVSRALNNPSAVKAETRAVIERAVASLNYRPNCLGRNLRLQRTSVILVILNSIANNFYVKVIRGIEDEAKKSGYSIMICAMHDDAENERAYIDLLKNKLADGIIFMNTTLSAQSLFELSKQYAVVQCSEYYEHPELNNESKTGTKKSVPYISIDNERAAYDAVRYLLSTGRKRIAHITVNNNNISTVKRLNGYRRAITEAGLSVCDRYVVFGNYGYRSAYAAMTMLLAQDPPPDAVFAISDRMAAGAIKRAIDAGFSVPEDVAVFGFDNTDISNIYIPPISTVSQSQYRMGAEAMNMISTILSGGNVRQKIILGHELIIRRST